MILRVAKEMVSKVIAINRNRILLLKRAEDCVTEKSPWTWDLPGGHRESKESMREAGRREMLEETGLEVGEFSFVGKESDRGKLIYFYKTKPSGGSIKLSDEHIEYRWVDKKELNSYSKSLGDMYYRMSLRAL